MKEEGGRRKEEGRRKKEEGGVFYFLLPIPTPLPPYVTIQRRLQ
jgi:hypothetical protein